MLWFFTLSYASLFHHILSYAMGYVSVLLMIPHLSLRYPILSYLVACCSILLYFMQPAISGRRRYGRRAACAHSDHNAAVSRRDIVPQHHVLTKPFQVSKDVSPKAWPSRRNFRHASCNVCTYKIWRNFETWGNKACARVDHGTVLRRRKILSHRHG